MSNIRLTPIEEGRAASEPMRGDFHGAVEVLGGALLLWRRTTTLGALVVAAAMTQVVALNFAYDVPVKQYSMTLLLMALFLALIRFFRQPILERAITSQACSNIAVANTQGAIVESHEQADHEPEHRQVSSMELRRRSPIRHS